MELGGCQILNGEGGCQIFKCEGWVARFDIITPMCLTLIMVATDAKVLSPGNNFLQM